MFSWFIRRRQQAQRVEAEAGAIISSNPVAARSETGQRRQNGQEVDVFAQWDRVMRTVALLTQTRIGTETATGTADEEDSRAREPEPEPEPDLLEKLERLLQRRPE